jgi:hypothetical protein
MELHIVRDYRKVYLARSPTFGVVGGFTNAEQCKQFIDLNIGTWPDAFVQPAWWKLKGYEDETGGPDVDAATQWQNILGSCLIFVDFHPGEFVYESPRREGYNSEVEIPSRRK